MIPQLWDRQDDAKAVCLGVTGERSARATPSKLLLIFYSGIGSLLLRVIKINIYKYINTIYTLSLQLLHTQIKTTKIDKKNIYSQYKKTRISY